MFRFGCVVMLVSLVVVGCSSLPSQRDMSKEQVFICGAYTVKTEFKNEQLVVRFDDRQDTLNQQPVASGAKFVSEDGESIFWNKGDTANFIWRGESLPDCRAADSLPKAFSASGNEPFWALSMNAQQVEVSTPEKEWMATVTEIESVGDDTSVPSWRVNTANGDQLDIRSKVCRDSMSGMIYPFTVNYSGDFNATGCGGETIDLLQGPKWILTEANASMTPSSNMYIQFLADGKLVGSDGCNQRFGQYQFGSEMVHLKWMGSTRRACSATVMEDARSFAEAVNNVRAIDFDQNTLIIESRTGTRLKLKHEKT